MRVIFMGTPDFSVGTLEEIIKAGHEVVLVVSQPDKAVGRIVAQHRSSGLSSTAIRIPECPHSAWTKVLIREISF